MIAWNNFKLLVVEAKPAKIFWRPKFGPSRPKSHANLVFLVIFISLVN